MYKYVITTISYMVSTFVREKASDIYSTTTCSAIYELRLVIFILFGMMDIIIKKHGKVKSEN